MSADTNTPSRPAFRAAYPLDFHLRDAAEQPALSSRTASGQTLYLYIENQSAGQVSLADLGANHPPSADQWHFCLRFRKGTLKHLDQIKVEADGWSVKSSAPDTPAHVDEIYLSGPKGAVGPGQLLGAVPLPLTGVTADKARGTRNTRIEFLYRNLQFNERGPLLSGRREQTLSVVNQDPPQDTRIPIDVGFAGSNTVLTTPDAAAKSSLMVQLTNVADAPISFDPARRSRVVLRFDVDDNLQKKWALCRQDQVDLVNPILGKWDEGTGVEWPDSNGIKNRWTHSVTPAGQWEFTPPESSTVLGPGGFLVLSIEGIRTSLPAGPTNLYVHLESIPDPLGAAGYYPDEEYKLQVQKAPLAYDNAHVGIGVALKDTLALNVAGRLAVAMTPVAAPVTFKSTWNNEGCQVIPIYSDQPSFSQTFTADASGLPTSLEVDLRASLRSTTIVGGTPQTPIDSPGVLKATLKLEYGKTTIEQTPQTFYNLIGGVNRAVFPISTTNAIHQGEPVRFSITLGQDSFEVTNLAEESEGADAIRYLNEPVITGGVLFEPPGVRALRFELKGHFVAFVAGGVGIGTDTPQAALDVKGSAIIDGKVGIGTDAPQAGLDVNGDATISGRVGIGGALKIGAWEISEKSGALRIINTAGNDVKGGIVFGATLGPNGWQNITGKD